MKKMLGLLLVGLIGCATTLSASNVLMKKTNGAIYGVNGSTITYVYSDVKVSGLKDGSMRDLLEAGAKKSLCKDEEMKALVDAGITIQYIYLGHDNKEGAIFTINNCN